MKKFYLLVLEHELLEGVNLMFKKKSRKATKIKISNFAQFNDVFRLKHQIYELLNPVSKTMKRCPQIHGYS